MKKSLLSLITLLLFGFIAASAESASCPIAVNGSVCAEFTEPSGVTNLKETVVTIKRDGVALPAITIPASAATGGALQATSVVTLPCVVDTYTVEAFSNYATSLGVMPSLTVTGTPGGGVIKDRTSEPACLKVPTNFTIH